MTQTQRVRCTRIMGGYVMLIDVNVPGAAMLYTVRDFARHDFMPSIGMEFDLRLDDVTDVDDNPIPGAEFYTAEVTGIGNVTGTSVRTP